MIFTDLFYFFFNDNCIDYALIQKINILDFKFPTPDKNNQITQDFSLKFQTNYFKYVNY